MKKYMSLVSVPAVNIGAFLYAQIPAFGIIEEVFKILVLAASFVFTVFRIVGLFRKREGGRDGGTERGRDGGNG